MTTQTQPIDVVAEVKKDLVAIRTGYEVTPVQYHTLMTLLAETKITLDGTDEQSIDQVFATIETDFNLRDNGGRSEHPLADLYSSLLDATRLMKQCLLEKRF